MTPFDPQPLQVDACVVDALLPSDTATDRVSTVGAEHARRIVYRVLGAWSDTMPPPPPPPGPTFVMMQLGDEPRGHIVPIGGAA